MSIAEGATPVVVALGYDDLSRRTSLTRGASVMSSTLGYDPVSRLQTLTHDLAGTGADVTQGFSYNPASQAVTRTISNDAYVFAEAPNGTRSYSANGLNQYTQITTPAALTPTYDANGKTASPHRSSPLDEPYSTAA